MFVPLARFWNFRKCFHAHKWAGACFSLYDIGQTGATSHPLPDCAPRSSRVTRTACPRWKPYSAPRREELYRILARLHNAQQAHPQTAHSTPGNTRKHRLRHPVPRRPRWKLCPHPAGRSGREAPARTHQPPTIRPRTWNPDTGRPARAAPALVMEHPPGGHDQHPPNATQKESEPQ